MRDTLIGLAVLAAIIGGYLYSRNPSSSDLGVAAPSAVTAEASSRRRTKPIAKTTGGAKYASKQNPTAQSRVREDHESRVRSSRKSSRENRRFAGPTSESALLPSLYSSSSDRGSEGEALVEPGESGSDSGGGPVVEQRVKPKVIHGVAVDAWAGLQRNALARPAVTGADKAGMRVIFQCHELKGNGAQFVGNRNCGEMAAKSREGTAALTGRGSERVY